MSYTKDEVELMLALYPIAKVHLSEIEMISKIRKEGKLSECEKLFKDYYSFVISIVDCWLNVLFPDEIEIIRLRKFNKKTFDYIAIQCGYLNHSSIVRKYKRALNKISQLEVVWCEQDI